MLAIIIGVLSVVANYVGAAILLAGNPTLGVACFFIGGAQPLMKFVYNIAIPLAKANPRHGIPALIGAVVVSLAGCVFMIVFKDSAWMRYVSYGLLSLLPVTLSFYWYVFKTQGVKSALVTLFGC